jgi:hypothetical protein
MKDFELVAKRRRIALADVDKLRRRKIISRKENIPKQAKLEDQSNNSIVPAPAKPNTQEYK